MQVLSRYDVRREIGRGGMGVVYEAHDARLRRTVALKMLAHGAADPRRRSRFEQEARAASALNHPNIVTIHDVVAIGENDCIVMEHVDGESLSAPIVLGPLAVDVALGYAVQIASALAAAHAAGIVHRDLKPANVMVTRDHRIKVLDFGLSKLLQRDAPSDAATAAHSGPHTEPGLVTGTAGYMSPEQASGDPVDARTDIFSFGTVLYEMLSGKRAFEGDSYWSTLRAVVQHEPQPLGRVRPDVPAAVAKLVARCLDKDPARRFANGTELAAALTTLMPRAAQQTGRRRVRRAAAVAIIIAITALAMPLYQTYTARVRAAALEDLERDIDQGRYATAYVRARELERKAPGDAEVQRALLKITSPWTMKTDPQGATVHFKEYGDPNAPWHLLGVTPIAAARPPGGALHWRVTKDGFQPVEGRFWWGLQGVLRLHPISAVPSGMVYAPGGPAPVPAGPSPMVPAHWIDKYEVTNAEYKPFVDAGAYRDQRWWKHEIIHEGRTLAWADAMRLFVDRTGRPGPATWEAGTYPAGRGDFPVSGVSWYEAAAFAEFMGKSLPTIYQWQFAGGPPNLRHDVRLANFGAAPAPVSSLRDLGPNGTYGLAGNVKEWVWNGTDGQRYIMGGSWNEPPYMATQADARPPADRAETHGIRLVKHTAPPAADSLADLEILEKHFPPRAPVSDEVFDAYRRFYVYERTPLDVKVEGATETEYWKDEVVSIAAAYRNERVPIHLLLPKNAAPPYQAVIWCPGSYSIMLDEGDRMTMSYYFDFVAKSGRAVIMPDFQGFYSRRSTTPARAREPESQAFRDRVIDSAKDLNRTMDYLETRPDIDARNVAYYVFSVGGSTLAVPAMEPRLKGIIFLSAGIPRRLFPPEIEPINFAPRIKVPVLFLSGRYDYLTPVDASQKPLFDRIGAAAAAKKHVIFESGHVPERIAVIREVLGWLDQTLGPIKSRE